MTLPIYLDYAATTPIDPGVVESMLPYLVGQDAFGNPSSSHFYGKRAKQAVEEARFNVAHLISAEPAEIIWTSGATESNNLALKGAAYMHQQKGKHIITLKTEHPSVLDCCQELEKEGFAVSYLAPAANGLLELDELIAALRRDTILVSIMHVNNELGVVQDIKSIANITAARGILFHTDAAQSIGKIPLNVQQVPVDLVSLNAHKIYGPKGIGALYLRRQPRVKVKAQIHGGGQEMNMRSGTLAPHQIVGMGAAFHLAENEIQNDWQKITRLRNMFLHGMRALTPVALNGDEVYAIPGIVNLRFQHKKAEDFIKALPQIVFSTGSACLSNNIGSSHVLRALGLRESEIQNSIRFSLGRFTTAAEIESVISQFAKVLGTY